MKLRETTKKNSHVHSVYSENAKWYGPFSVVSGFDAPFHGYGDGTDRWGKFGSIEPKSIGYVEVNCLYTEMEGGGGLNLASTYLIDTYAKVLVYIDDKEPIELIHPLLNSYPFVYGESIRDTTSSRKIFKASKSIPPMLSGEGVANSVKFKVSEKLFIRLPENYNSKLTNFTDRAVVVSNFDIHEVSYSSNINGVTMADGYLKWNVSKPSSGTANEFIIVRGIKHYLQY